MSKIKKTFLLLLFIIAVTISTDMVANSAETYRWHCNYWEPWELCSSSSDGCIAVRNQSCEITCDLGDPIDCTIE